MMVPPLPTPDAVLNWPYATVPQVQLYWFKDYLREEMKATIFPSYLHLDAFCWGAAFGFLPPWILRNRPVNGIPNAWRPRPSRIVERDKA
jgi:hypothetical protein